MIKKLKKSPSNESVAYDRDWIQLIIEAKQSGLTIPEIRSFLQNEKSYTSMKSSLSKSNLHHI